MKTILVTGGAGFIGSHTCLALLERGYHIVIVDSFINSNPICIDRILKISDINKSKRLLKFNPKFDLKRGINKTIKIFIKKYEKT